MKLGRSTGKVVAAAALLASVAFAPRADAQVVLPSAVSPFFAGLDEVCTAARSAPDVTAVRAEVKAYCADRALVPSFAAEREGERLDALDAQRALLGLQPARRLALATPPARLLVELMVPTEEPRASGLTLDAVALAVREACEVKAAATTLPHTCAAPDRSPFSLVALRAALVDDATSLGSRGLAELGRVPGLESVVESLSFLAGILTGADLPELFERIDAVVERRVTAASGSAVGGATAGTAVELVNRLLRDGPVLDKPREHYERVVAAVLAERLKVGRSSSTMKPPPGVLGFMGDALPVPALSPQQAAATARLVAALGRLERARRDVRQGPTAEREIAALVLTALDVVESAYELARGEPRPIAPEARALIARVAGAAATGNARALADATADQLDAFERSGALSSTAVCASKTVLRVAFASNDAEVRRVLLTCVVELPPWMDKLLFAAHAGLPVFDAGTTRIDADLLLGYNGDSFGVSGFGSIYNYDFTDATGRSETFRTEASVDVWGSAKLGEKARFEGRFAAGGALYNTDVYPAARGYYEETSLMGRGSALVGLRLVPSKRFVAAAHAGGGVQVEVWDGTQIPAVGRRVVITDEVPVTARAVARLRAQWLAWPGVLSFRVSGDFDFLSITRAREVTTIGPGGGVTTTASESSVKQAELFARAYADIDRLELAGFRPVVHGGANVVNAGGQTAVVPVFGVGIRRETF